MCRRLLMTLVTVALAATATGCPDEVQVDQLQLSITSESPAGGAVLDHMRILFFKDGVRFPESSTDPRTNVPLSAAFSPVQRPIVINIPYSGETFSDGPVTLQVAGFVDGRLATYFEGEVELTAKKVLSVRMLAVAAECDADADGFVDCAVPGCCANGSSPLSDCEPTEAEANPWGVEDVCEPCDDQIDQDCDGTDQPCVDDDQDGIPDCEEQECGLGDATVGPGLPEICDGKDNDCDGETDEAFFVQEGGNNLGLGADCGLGECKGGKVECADATSAVCSTADQAEEEDCSNEVDDDCDGFVNEGCEALDPDGDGIAGSDGDCNDYDSSVFPGAPEGCCPPNIAQGPNAMLLCDKNCDESVTECDANDADGDGYIAVSAGGDDCDDNDPLVHVGAPEKCGDGKDQDCFGGDVDCASVTDLDGDKWSPPADCDDTNAAINPEASEQCDGVDNDCDGFVDDGNPNTQNSAACGSDVGQCALGTKVCVNSGGYEGEVLCVGDVRPTAEVCDGLDNDCDGETDEDFKTGGIVSLTDLDGTAGLVLGDACGVGACGGGTVVCGAGGANLVCDSHVQASADVCDGADNDCDGQTDESYKAGGTVKYTDLDGTTGLVLGANCGTGACMGGTVVCGADQSSLTCSTNDQASQDVCDALDNDCDGQSDEEYVAGGSVKFTDLDGTTGLVKGDSCGTGTCNGGTVTCAADKSSLTCSTIGLASADICDGADNDCDGSTDEAFVAGGTVKYTAPDGTSGLVIGDSCGSGQCAGGTVVCGATGDQLTCSTQNMIAQDVCDGLDNDCDGETDEAFVAGGAVKFTDLDGTTGLVKGDSCGVGACSNGTVVCGADEASLACTTSGNASADVCDGEDNDCDGSTDEAYVAGGTVKYTDLDGTTGLVKGDSCGVGACGGGSVVCGADESSLTCSTAGAASADVCDGADNDCDGDTDEDYKSGGTVKFTDLNGTGGLVLGDSCGVGACNGGNVLCSADGGSLVCSTGGAATAEVCDAADNDCDGQTDEDYKSGGTVTYTDLNGTTGLVLGDGCGTGACNGGDVVCAPGGGSLTCSTAGSASQDLCDGADNDCDGQTDEAFVAGGTVKFTDWNGAQRVLGQGCGTGACSGGQVQCSADGNQLVCDSASSASSEQCDAADNDCDGQTDEDFKTGGAVKYTDPDGTTGLVLGDGCGSGACGGGNVVCGGDGKMTCSTASNASPDVCDGADNDCDGATDEAFVSGGTVTYTDWNGAARVKGQSCGTGACSSGTVQCATGGETLTCSTIGNASPDVCDGADNDCDGTTDEAFVSGGTVKYVDWNGAQRVKGDSCGTGSCANGNVVCGSDGNTLACTTSTNATPDICDGADNDCDGTTDEAYIAGGSVKFTDWNGSQRVKGDSCGTGACNGGSVQCTGDGSGLACSTASNVSPDVCDGADNDCDGTTDEDYKSGGTVTLTDLDGTSGLVLGDGCGTGACNGGNVVCSGGGLACDSHGNVSSETCDGADNDCDGSTDENYKAGGTVTLTDLDGTGGLVLGDGCGTGACNGGNVVCSNGGLACSTHTSASGETCDGVDNDCDGGIDENYKAGGTVTLTDLDGTSGLVLGDGCGTGACNGGNVVCANGGLACDTHGNVSSETCDNADNDCDGGTDENYKSGGTVSLTDLNGDAGLVLGDSCGAGDCAGGQVQCSSDGGLRCTTHVNASPDLCDGDDNDCDGDTDEDFGSGGTITYTDLDGTSGLVKGDGCGVGDCNGGSVGCDVNGGLTCDTASNASTEACDDADNDCDGQTDEDFGASGSVRFTDWDASQRYKGQSCGTGDCAGGGVVCTADGNGLTCDSLSSASADTCNGADDDCDGQTDEDYKSGGTVTLTDLDGTSGLVLTDSCGVGACTGGTVQCASNEQGLVCSSHGSASGELCDDADNDCDGQTDEDYKSGGTVTYTDLDGTSGLALGNGCGVGDCNGGTVECAGDQVSLTCSTLGSVSSETCNSQDDDCDGITDNGPPETCDGVDNDCDSQTDEDLIPAVDNDCATDGVCGEEVVAVCGGVAGWSCTYTSPDFESGQESGLNLCDDLDNDCDTSTDEDCSAGSLACALPSSGSDPGFCMGCTGDTDCAASGWTCTTVGADDYCAMDCSVPADCTSAYDSSWDCVGSICVKTCTTTADCPWSGWVCETSGDPDICVPDGT